MDSWVDPSRLAVLGLDGLMYVTKDGRSWRIGTATDVAWLAGQTRHGLSITTAIPPRALTLCSAVSRGSNWMRLRWMNSGLRRA